VTDRRHHSGLVVGACGFVRPRWRQPQIEPILGDAPGKRRAQGAALEVSPQQRGEDGPREQIEGEQGVGHAVGVVGGGLSHDGARIIEQHQVRDLPAVAEGPRLELLAELL
jgi:hypothetical protein